MTVQCPVSTEQPLFTVQCAHNLFLKKTSLAWAEPRLFHFRTPASSAALCSLSPTPPYLRRCPCYGVLLPPLLWSSSPLASCSPPLSSLSLSLFICLESQEPTFAPHLQILWNCVKFMCANVSSILQWVSRAGIVLRREVLAPKTVISPLLQNPTHQVLGEMPKLAKRAQIDPNFFPAHSSYY
jgi:hypothetical protein